MDTQFDAIVIGAGPAGSSAAILLANAGWHVALVEKQSYPRRKVCGECIAATNLSILDALGIGKAFSRCAGPSLRHVALVCGAGTVRAPLPAYADPTHPWGAALGREHLDTMLLEQARYRGVSVFQPWQAYGIDGEAGNYHCRLRTAEGREERLLAAPVVIDAHGSWEPQLAEGMRDVVRRSRPGASDLFAFKANFIGAALDPGLLPLLSFPGGYGGIVLGGGETITFAFCLRRDALMRARLQFPEMKPADAAHSWVKHHCRAAVVLLGEAVQNGKWLGAGPLRPGIHIGRRGPGVLQIGNAAGEAHPIIGEGISMALQSAVLLAKTLLHGDGRPPDSRMLVGMQSQYARLWRRQFANRIQMSALYAHIAMRPRIFAGLLPVLARNPAMLTSFARWCGKVHPAPGMATEAAAQGTQ